MKRKLLLVFLLILAMLFVGCEIVVTPGNQAIHVRFEDNGEVVNDCTVNLDGKIDAFELLHLYKEGYTVGIYKDSSFTEEWNINDLITEDITLYLKYEKNKYEVIIDGNKQEVEYGTSINPETPKKEGYTFIGWYLDSNFNTKWNNEKITNNITLYPKYEINKYKVVLDGEEKEVEYGTTLEEYIPEKVGYTFIGWYKDTLLTKKWEGKVESNITLYSKFEKNKYIVKFNGTTLSDIEVEYRETIEEPKLEKVGYTLKGWYLDSEYKKEWNFKKDKVESNITLYPQYITKKYTVTFEELNNVTIEYDSLLERPSNPSKVGYTFIDWYKDSNLTQKWDFNSDKVKGTTTIYAKWEINKYQVTFDGYSSLNKEVEYGKTIGSIDNPKKSGYSFGGWYLDSELKTKVSLDTYKVESDITLYAKWSKVSSGGGSSSGGSTTPTTKYTVTYNTNGGNSITSESVTKGSKLTLKTPTYEGHKFIGWYKEESLTNAWNFTSDTVTSNVTLYAKWEEDSSKYTKGLEFKLNSDGKSYSVTGYNGEETDIIIPSKYKGLPLTSIWEYAFSDCTSLTSITIPESIENIGEGAFAYCTSLTSITIPNSVISIGYRAFYKCTSLIIYCEIGSEPSSWDSNWNRYDNPVYYGVKEVIEQNDIQYLIIDGNAVVTRYVGNSENVEIPSTIIYNNNTYNVIKIGDCSFVRSKVSHITLTNTVTNISAGAFTESVSLRSVVIPNSVTSIGNGAFDWCISLESIIIPNSVENIGDFAFANCNSLTIYCEVEEVPTTWDENWNVSDCEVVWNIRTVTFEENEGSLVKDIIVVSGSKITSLVTTRPGFTFEGWYKDEQLTKKWDFDSDTVTTNITLYAKWIEGTEGLKYKLNDDEKSYSVVGYNGKSTDVVIPTKYNNLPVTSISESAFYNCVLLESVKLGNSIKTISKWAFEACSSLTTITIPKGVEYVAERAFINCASLASINVEEGNLYYKSIDGNLYYVNDKNEKTLVQYAIGKEEESFIIPNDVIIIGDGAFYNCRLTSITIPSSVTSIYDFAFYGCTSITSIKIPNSVTSISDYVFSGCTSLESITIPSSLKTLGNAFVNNKSLDKVYYDGTIADWCNIQFTQYANSNPMYFANHFYMKDSSKEYQEVTEIVIPETITKIGDCQFVGFSNVTSITIPSSVESIGRLAFYNCLALKNINVDDNNGNYCSIDGNLYSKDKKTLLLYAIGKNGKTFTIPNSVESIGDYAFFGCASLESIIIPNSVKKIVTAFDENTLLKNVYYDGTIADWCNIQFTEYINSNPMYYASHFYIKNKYDLYDELTEIVIPETITKIGDCQFAGFSNVTSVTIPSSVTSIGLDAFYNCTSLANVTIPSSVTTISTWAFEDCTSLESIIIPNSVSYIGSEAFLNCSLLKIYCEETSQPEDWEEDWNISGCEVIWNYKNVEKVEVSIDIEKVEVGFSTNAHASVYPLNTLQDVTWKSSDESVATIDENGKISTKKVGITYITAYSKLNGEVVSQAVKLEVVKGMTPIIETDLQGYVIEIMVSESQIGEYDPFLDSYTGLDKEYKQKAWKEIEADYNCTLSIVSYPDEAPWGSARYNWINSQAELGQAKADFAFVNSNWIDKLANAESLVDVKKLYEKYGNNLMSTYQIESATYKNGLYGIATESTVGKNYVDLGLYYNLGWIEELGVTSPAKLFNEGNWTYSTFINWVNEVYELIDEDEYVLAGSLYYYWLGMSNAAGIKVGDVNEVKVNLIDEKQKEIAELLQGLATSGALSTESNWMEISGEFIDGTAVMTSGHWWFMKAANRWPSDMWGDDTRYGYVPFPYPDDMSKDDTKSAQYGFGYLTMLNGRDSKYPSGVTQESIYCTIADYYLRANEYYKKYGVSDANKLKEEKIASKVDDPESVKAAMFFDESKEIYDAAHDFYDVAAASPLPNTIAKVVKGEDYVSSISSVSGQYVEKFMEKYDVEKYDVIFANTNLEKIKVKDGNLITKPTDPKKAGYTFEGWYKDSSFEIEWNFQNDRVTNDTTLYAKWEEKVTEGLVFELNEDEKSYSVVGYNGKSTEVVIPTKYNNLPVTSIQSYAFSDCSTLTSVVILSSIESIGENAFEFCRSLTNINVDENNKYYSSIDGNLYSKDKKTLIQYAIGKEDTTFTIPNTVESIGNNAFEHNTTLESVEIANSVISISEYAFAFSRIVNVEIPNSVESIGSYAFYCCKYLKNVKISSSVKNIGNMVFYYCTSLTNINVDENNENYSSIDGNLYSKDKKTLIQYAIGKEDTTFTIPNSVTNIKDNAFSYCVSLTSITISNSVTSIGNEAFTFCSLVSIELPSSVESIGEYAFSYSTLTSINVDENNKYYSSIDGNLYTKDKKTLIQYAMGKKDTTFTIPNSVTNINAGAFTESVSLRSVVIPNSVTSIGNGAFDWCISLESITIPNSVTYIGGWAFSNCLSLTIYCEVSSKPENWHESWNSSNSEVVWNVKTVTFEENGGSLVKDIIVVSGSNITSPVTTRPGFTFEGWYKDSNLTQKWDFDSDTVTTNITLYAKWIEGTEGLKYELNDDEESYSVVGYNGESTDVVIPTKYNNLPVTSIKRYAFSGCSTLTNVVILSSIESIGEYAFYNCLALKNINVDENNGNYCSIDGNLYSKDKKILIQYAIGKEEESFTIPNDVIIIGDRAFYNCNLSSVTIPSSVTSIGNEAFYKCASLESVIISNSVESIGSAAFRYCTSLTSIEIPNSVESIGSYAFDGCYSLTSINVAENNQSYCSIDGNLYSKDKKTLIQYAIGKEEESFTIPNDVIIIGDRAFYNCNLSSVTIPNGVTSIGEYAFYNCLALESVSIGSNVESIGRYAFEDCTSLSSIIIPDSVRSIGNAAFADCITLTSINVDEKNEYYCSIDGNLYSKDKKTLIQYAIGKKESKLTIPNSVENIEFCAFYNCTSLTSIAIPNSISSIDEGAFLNCLSLTSIVLPRSVTSIDNFAFSNCTSLTSIIIPNSVTSIGGSAFSYCLSLTIYCEVSSKPENWHESWNSSNCEVVWNVRTVTFEENEGSLVKDIIVVSGSKITSPTITRTGYKLEGWYKDEQLTKKWDFENEKVTENITLYAKWVAKEKFTIKLENTDLTSLLVYEDDLIPQISTSVQDGKVVVGWYKESTFDNEWDFDNDRVTEGITLYAKWLPLAKGVYSYVNSSYSDRTEILGVLEKYAIESGLTGITLYEDTSYVLYSTLVDMGSETYIPGYGYGILQEGKANADLAGEANEDWKRYYHTYETGDPMHINYGDSQNSTIDDLSSYIFGSFWDIKLNKNKDGYEWFSALANEMPQALNANSTTGLATKYKFEVKIGSELKYNTLSNNENLNRFAGQEVKVEDYLTLWKIMYTQANGWERGSIGLTGAGSIKGLNNYYYSSSNGYNETAWAKVGLKVYEENGKGYLEVEFNQSCSAFYAMYYLSSSLYTPIPEEFIEAIGGAEYFGKFDDENGLTPVDTTLSTGPYVLEEWDKYNQIVFKKNEYYHNDSLCQGWDGVHIAIEGLSQAYDDFINEKMHTCSVPLDKLQELKDDPRVYKLESTSTTKLNLNVCDQETWEKLFGENGTITQTNEEDYWECEPALANHNFVLGLSYAINRSELAASVGKTPSVNYLGAAYMANPEDFISYNSTLAHKNAISSLIEGTDGYGYSLEKAKAYFRLACEELLASGAYKEGDVITLEMAWQGQSNIDTYQKPLEKYLKEAFNDESVCDGKLTLEIKSWTSSNWSDVYYYKMMVGQYDIAYGGISGNTLNPINFFEVLKSDNSSGFTLNWGIDTSEISTDLIWDDMVWSFDALWQAAETGCYVEEGKVKASYAPELIRDKKNDDGTATIEIKANFVKTEGISIEVTDAKIYGASLNEGYSEDSLSFSYNEETDIITIEVSEDLYEKYGNVDMVYLGIDIYMKLVVLEIDSQTISSITLNGLPE